MCVLVRECVLAHMRVCVCVCVCLCMLAKITKFNFITEHLLNRFIFM